MKRLLVVPHLMFSLLLGQVALAGSFETSGDQEASKLVFNTFQTTRLVNMHSTEVLQPKQLDFRVTHRFGNVAGSQGGYHTFFGMDQSSDIRISLEYGLSDRMMVGIGRSKGAGAQREIYDGFLKYRILRQTQDGKMPLSMTLVTSSHFTGMRGSTDTASASYFGNAAHRLTYATSLIIARKMGDFGSIQIAPEYIHRNYVAYNDENGIFAVAVGGRVRLSQMISIIGEYHYVLTEHSNEDVTYVNPSSIGFEFYTGGHVFHMNFSNSRGLGEGQFVPGTVSKWSEGEFRLGFNISKIFEF